MVTIFTLSVLLLLSTPVAADPDANAVNERIPVSSAELEGHWQVDCDGVWRQLAQTVHLRASSTTCKPLPGIRRDLQLCSFIYQAPGEEPRRRCPDYRGALDLMKNGLPDKRCAELASFLLQQEACL